VPAPGDPFYANYTKDPLNAPVTAPPTAVAEIPPLVDPPQPVSQQSGDPAVPTPPQSPDGVDPPVVAPVPEATPPTEGGN